MFERVLETDPDNLDVLDWLSVVRMTRYNRTRDERDLEKAEGYLRRLLKDRPTGIAVLNLVEVLAGTGRLAEARALLATTRAKDPGDIDIEVARLEIAVREGDEKLATGIATEIYKRRPTEVTAALFLGRRAYNDQQYDEALEKLQNAVADPFCKWSSHPEAYAFLARVLKRLGRLEEAIEAAMQGIKRCPKDKRLARILDEIVNKQS